MDSFKVRLVCHHLKKQKCSSLLATSSKEAVTIMKYSDKSRICSTLHGIFGNVRLLDGGLDEYTDAAVTGDQTGTVWSLPDTPDLYTVEDIADSVLDCHSKKVCFAVLQRVSNQILTSTLHPRVYLHGPSSSGHALDSVYTSKIACRPIRVMDFCIALRMALRRWYFARYQQAVHRNPKGLHAVRL
jgi:hypothetical protein